MCFIIETIKKGKATYLQTTRKTISDILTPIFHCELLAVDMEHIVEDNTKSHIMPEGNSI